MKIPPEAIANLITVLFVAQSRGMIDVRMIEPFLRIVVDSGNAHRMRSLLGEVLQMLETIEAEPRSIR